MAFNLEKGVLLTGKADVVDAENESHVVATLTFDVAFDIQGSNKNYKIKPNVTIGQPGACSKHTCNIFQVDIHF
jgi:hypothetical protein